MNKIALTLLALCSLVHAQEKAPPSPMMPAPPEMKRLDVLAGEWIGKMTITEPGAPEMRVDATMKGERFAGGVYFRTVYTMDIPNVGRFEGTIMTGWDAQAKTYRSWTFENAAPMPREETGTFEGDKYVTISKPYGGMVTRATFDFKSARELVFTVEMKQGEKWVKIGEATCTKKSS